MYLVYYISLLVLQVVGVDVPGILYIIISTRVVGVDVTRILYIPIT